MTTTEPKHATIIYVRGIPGSGKSYLAHKLAAALANEQIVELDPDAIDMTSEAYKRHVAQLSEEGVDASLHLYRFLRAQAYRGIEAGATVIWNQPFTNLDIFNKMTQRMYDHALASNVQLSILVVEVEVDTEVARQRIAERKNKGGHGPTNGTFTRFVDDYASFADKGYITISVDGTALSETSIQNIIDKLQSLRAA